MSAMREMDEMQERLFTTVEQKDFVPADHPRRPMRPLVNEALKRLNGLFGVIYADSGRASIALEKQSLVCRSGSLDWPDRLPVAQSAEGVRTMAYGVHAFLHVASQGGNA